MHYRAGVMQRFATLVVGMALVAAFLGAYSNTKAGADHEPANKVAAAGSSTEKFDDATPVLSETIKASSGADLILSLTAECSIITELSTGGNGPDTSEAMGSVTMWITIDDKVVPVSSDDEDGKVTFCKRVYGRSVSDTEGDGDVDSEDDYIRTKTANGFNWLALDTGFIYDDPANGNNILEIVVWADYETSEAGEAVADAFVGKRTLIAEPTNASVHESVDPADA
jgi:hypothetical protein